MLLRRHFLLGAASALALSACSGDSAVTVQQIIDWVKDKCSFVPTVDSVIQVILTVLSTFNAQAGAAATVAASVAKAVQEAICDAVSKQVAQLKLQNRLPTASSPSKAITVVVNGVKVVGEYTGS